MLTAMVLTRILMNDTSSNKGPNGVPIIAIAHKKFLQILK